MRILVTGASRGIGRATALELAGEHDVAVNYRESETAAREVAERVREAGAEATAVRADVSDPAEAERLVEETADALGGVDAVVNNAGVVAPDRLTEIDDDQWRRVIETNLSGAFYVTRAAMPRLVPGGDVVFVSSIGGTDGTVDAGYAASKAGLHGLARALAREYGADGVQVNAVAPGPAETDLNEAILDHLKSVEFRGHADVDTHLPEYACEPATVAHSVAYLLENDYVQGTVLSVDGGMGLA